MTLAFYLPDLHTYLRYLVSCWDSSHIDILDREVTEYSRRLIYEMCVSRRIALVVSLTMDPWESPDHPFLCHSFDIAIYSRSSYLRTDRSHFIIDILSREMPTLAGTTDDITVLVLTHRSIMRKNLTKSNKKTTVYFLFFAF